MAKLIGTDPNQVPTNADLGTMAYQDYDVVDKEFRNSRPNLIINGDFQVWQRSDNAYTSANGYVSADRYKTTRGRIRKPNTNGNSGEDDRGAIFDTTDGSVFVHYDYFVEDVGQKLSGKKAVLSFEYKAISPASFGLYMENASSSGYGRLDLGANITLTAKNYEWRKAVLVGTITYDGSGEYFRLPRWYVNPTGGNSGQNLQIDKVKLELVEDGYENATPFISKPYHEELAACQRYYQRYTESGSSNYGPTIGYGTFNGSAGATTSEVVSVFQFPVAMRTGPDFAFSNLAHFDLEPFDHTITALETFSHSSPFFHTIKAVSSTARETGFVGFICMDSANGWFEFDAEL